MLLVLENYLLTLILFSLLVYVTSFRKLLTYNYII